MLTKRQEKEYQAVRKGVGWARLDGESVFEVTGKDAIPFLHGMVSNDVKSLKEGEGCYAACLTNTGKMISDLRIYALSGRLLIALPKKEKEKILAHLDKFIFTEEVLFRDMEEEAALLSVQGSRSRALLGDVTGTSFTLKIHEHHPFQKETIFFRLFAESRTGEEGYDILVSKKAFPGFCEMLQDTGRPYGLQEIHDDTLDILRIEAGIPRYGVDMDESTIPLEAGLEEAVSFTKGCYIGQEVIARIKYIGHVNRSLVGLKLPGPVSRGDPIVQETEEVGRVSSSCHSPFMNTHVALAMIHRNAATQGTPVEVRTQKGTQQATVTALPFYART